MLPAEFRAVAQSWIRTTRSFCRAATIYGGTSEIQKDIESLRLLGLTRSA